MDNNTDTIIFHTYLKEEPYFGANLPNGWKRIRSGLFPSQYFYIYKDGKATWTPPEINFIEQYKIVRQNHISDKKVIVLDIPEYCPIVEIVRNIYSKSIVKAESGVWNQGNINYDIIKDYLPMFCKLANDAGAKVIVPTETDFELGLNSVVAEVTKGVLSKYKKNLDPNYHDSRPFINMPPSWKIFFYITQGTFEEGGLSIYSRGRGEYSGENPISPICENGIRVVIIKSDVYHKTEGIVGLGEDCECGFLIFQLPANYD